MSKDTSKEKSKKQAKLNLFGIEKKKRKLSPVKSPSNTSDTSGSNRENSDIKSPSLNNTMEESFDFMSLLHNHWDEVIVKLQNSEAWHGLEDGMNQMVEDLQSMRLENETLKKRLAMTEGRLMRVEKKLEEANEKVIDLTVRSMRENIVLKNIPEQKDENLEVTLKSVFSRKLKMSEHDLDEVEIVWAHRFGRFRPGQTRNIVAKVTMSSKTKILEHAKNIPRGDNLRIQEQLPQEIHTRRNKLWPIYIQAKKDGKRAKFKRDTLIVDSNIINPPKDQVRDINLDITKRSLEISAGTKHTGVVNHDRDHLQGHIIPIKSTDDVIPAIQSLCHDQRVAGATHIMYAYRIGNERCNTTNFEDDGQYGGGREVMSAIMETESYNCLVAVTRWQGGKHNAHVQYDRIKNIAKEAVKLLK